MFTSLIFLFFACGEKDADSSADTAQTTEDTSVETDTGESTEGNPGDETGETTDPTSADLFCELYSATCGDWSANTVCEDWYNAAEEGTQGDTTGATQSCYEYHLAAAANAEDQAGIDMHCAHARGEADANGNAPCQ